MDIKEIKQLKANMEIELKEMIYEFQTKTGLAVNDIDLIHPLTVSDIDVPNNDEMSAISTSVNTRVKL